MSVVPDRQAAFPWLDVGSDVPGRDQPSEDKLRGGYYTPAPIPDVLCRWALPKRGGAVLEPSCGDGRFLAAAESLASPSTRIVGIELDEVAAASARRNAPRSEIVRSDAFRWFFERAEHRSFDAVVGNPPFIRYQNFPEPHRSLALRLMVEAGLRPSKLTNAWLPFVVLATRMLKTDGRLAMVLPAELLQVSYAAQLREYLVKNYGELTLVTFRKLVFEGIQQETVLLLGRRTEGSAGSSIGLLALSSLDELKAGVIDETPRAHADLDHAREKWTQFYLSRAELGLVRELEASESLAKLSDVAEIDVGVVTGNNDFFVLTDATVSELGASRHCVPVVSRTAQVAGLHLRRKEFKARVQAGARCWLLNPGDVAVSELPLRLRKYVADAERRGVQRGYKCALRLPRWWNVPACWVPDGFLVRQVHDAARVIVNDAGATSTDTIHRVRMRKGHSVRALAAISATSLFQAFAEIRGRSYGGGVLELEPTEAEGLPIARPSKAWRESLPELDAAMKSGDVLGAADAADARLRLETGLSQRDLKHLRAIWQRLAGRRRQRK